MNYLERIRRVLLPLLLTLLLAAPVSAADCPHEYVEKRLEPTCEDQGILWFECALCGDTTDYDRIPALGHGFADWYVLTEATCTREGVQARDCLVCGGREMAPLPRLSHAYVAEVKHPTCNAGGYTRYTCHSCSSYYIAEYTNPLGHSYDSFVIQEPTDTTKGQVRFTCIRCDDRYQLYYTFRDLDSDAYYFMPVIWAVNKGITSGLDESHFGPDALCSRAQVVTFLWRAAGRPEVRIPSPFADVPAGSFYEQAVLWAYKTGITTGTDATHFSPDAPCNRAQVVTFLHRFRGCPEPTVTTAFPDVQPGAFYHKAVLWAAQRGITVGMDGGSFRPELPCSRAQIVTFLYRDEKNP